MVSWEFPGSNAMVVFYFSQFEVTSASLLPTEHRTMEVPRDDPADLIQADNGRFLGWKSSG
jgi:hypothetical protein